MPAVINYFIVFALLQYIELNLVWIGHLRKGRLKF